MDPGPIFLTVKSTATKSLFTFLQFTFLAIYFSAIILHPRDTFNPLCSAKQVSLTTSLNSWDKVICCLCAGLHAFAPSEATSFSYWSIKPWFYYQGKIFYCAHHAFLWRHCTHQEFLAPLPGRKITSSRGVSHSQSLYFDIFFAFLFLFVALYQKAKKISLLYIVFICVTCFNFVKWLLLKIPSCVTLLPPTIMILVAHPLLHHLLKRHFMRLI